MIEGQRNVTFSQNGELGRSCARVMKGRLLVYEPRSEIFFYIFLVKINLS